MSVSVKVYAQLVVLRIDEEPKDQCIIFDNIFGLECKESRKLKPTDDQASAIFDMLHCTNNIKHVRGLCYLVLSKLSDLPEDIQKRVTGKRSNGECRQPYQPGECFFGFCKTACVQ